MGYLEDSLFQAVGQDDLETVKKILAVDKGHINLKNDLKYTILHQCAINGSEKVFDFIYPQLKKARLNMYDKHKQTPFARAITGPSEKIFETMLNDDNVELEKCEDKETYGGATKTRYEPIYKLITKPDLKHRLEMYFNNKSSVKNNWSTWYGYAMWQNQEWAVNQVIENGEYDKMQDYTQKGGISNAIRFNRMNMVEIVYKHDPYVFEPGEMSNSPIVTALPRKDIMKVIFDLLPLKLNKTKSGKPYDDLISEVIRFKPETASEYLHEFMSRDIYISEKFIKDMIEKYGDIVFFQSCWARSDVDEFIVPLIENTKRYEQYLPQAAKDLFLF